MKFMLVQAAGMKKLVHARRKHARGGRKGY